jgi:hypothetical protein
MFAVLGMAGPSFADNLPASGPPYIFSALPQELLHIRNKTTGERHEYRLTSYYRIPLGSM